MHHRCTYCASVVYTSLWNGQLRFCSRYSGSTNQPHKYHYIPGRLLAAAHVLYLSRQCLCSFPLNWYLFLTLSELFL